MENLSDIMTSAAFSVDVSIIYAVIAIVLFGIMYRKERQTQEQRTTVRELLQQHPILLVVGIVLFALGMQYLCNYLISVIAMLFPSWLETYETLLDGMGLDDTATLPLILYSVLLAPICEELAFRGLTFANAKKIMPFWAANVVQALLFAGMHMNPLQASYTFVFALFLGYFMEKSGNLLLPMLVHLVFNGIAVLGSALLINSDNPIGFFLILFGSMVACYIGFEMIVRGLPRREQS
jgi:hypothetical protein